VLATSRSSCATNEPPRLIFAGQSLFLALPLNCSKPAPFFRKIFSCASFLAPSTWKRHRDQRGPEPMRAISGHRKKFDVIKDARKTPISYYWVERCDWLVHRFKSCSWGTVIEICFHFADKTSRFKDRLGYPVERTERGRQQFKPKTSMRLWSDGRSTTFAPFKFPKSS
jgi:hypothetical protein